MRSSEYNMIGKLERIIIIGLMLFLIPVVSAQDTNGELECPPNSHLVGTECYCDAGYLASGGSCISCNAYCAGNDPHSTGLISGDSCLCSCNYGYGVSEATGKCTSCNSLCKGSDPHSTWDGSADGCSCKCQEGYEAIDGVCTEVFDCDAYCKGDDPNSYGSVEGEDCYCYCIEGYEVVDGLCTSSQSVCNDFCNNVDPHMYGQVSGTDCNCICTSGYYYIENQGSCVSADEYSEQLCDEDCRADDPHAYGSIEGEICTCYCDEGYVVQDGACVSEMEYEDVECNRYCANQPGYAYGIVENGECNCYCEGGGYDCYCDEGYEWRDGECIMTAATCNAFCEGNDPLMYGIVEGDDCNCYCIEGYDFIGGECVTVVDEEGCDAICRADDPYSRGVIEGEDCMCYCVEGYVVVENMCTSFESICNSYCVGDDSNSHGIAEGEDCNCYCNDGYLYSATEGKCANAEGVCTSFCKENIPNSHGVMEGEDCFCYCDEGYVASEGTCVKKVEKIPPKDELKDKFDEEDISPEKPPETKMDWTTKQFIKDILGINVDEYEDKRGMGEGKTAYVIVSTSISGYERLWLGTKVNLMVTFFQYLGYEVRLIDRESTNTVFSAIAHPDTGAVGYFGHGPKGKPGIENMGVNTVDSVLVARERLYKEMYGLDDLQAYQRVQAEGGLKHLDMLYNHVCYGGDFGYQVTADGLLRPGGVYYGEEGILFGTLDVPHVKYVKPETSGHAH